jgi:aquaporin NIP
MASDSQSVARRPWQVYGAEMLGTAVLVFLGCGAVVMSAGPAGLVGIAGAFGIAVAIMIFAIGPISGAHINPAVTVALAATGHFPWKQVLPYVGAQILGALSGSLLHMLLFTSAVAAKASYGATTPSIALGGAVGVEVVLTFILMFVIMAFATDSRAPGAMAALAIGAVVVVDIIVGGPATGASMNPARSFGPAVFAQGAALANIWIYVVGPVVGALFGAFCFEAFRERPVVPEAVAVVEQPIIVGEEARR